MTKNHFIYLISSAPISSSPKSVVPRRLMAAARVSIAGLKDTKKLNIATKIGNNNINLREFKIC